jgi:20S proteasome alpha/beta subunit
VRLLKYEKPVTRKMTFILGSRCKDGVVLIADRKITIGEGEDYDECDKLFGEIRHVICGSSGDAGMFELFRGYVMDYINTHPNEVTFENAIVKLALCVLKINKEYGYPPNLYNVLVAIQRPQEGRKSRLNLIQGSGTPYTIKNYHVIGSGEPYAKVFLKRCWDDQMNMEQVAEIGYFIVKYIEDFKLNFTVGGEPMIWFVPDNEIENGEKIDYILKEKRPEQYARIRDNAIERFRKHEREINGLFAASKRGSELE